MITSMRRRTDISFLTASESYISSRFLLIKLMCLVVQFLRKFTVHSRQALLL